MTDQPKDTTSPQNVKSLGSPAHPASKGTASNSSNDSAKKSANAPHHAKTQKQGGGTSWVALLLGLAAIGFAGYNYWHNQQVTQSITLKAQALSDVNQQLSTNLVNAEERLSALEQTLQQQQQRQQQQQGLLTQHSEITEAYETQLQGLTESVAQLEAQAKQKLSLADNLGPTQAIAEAMDLAYRKLNFEKNVPATITLLETVIDTYCFPSVDASLTPTCLGLEADRVSLKQVPLPNLNRILQELEGVQNSLITESLSTHNANLRNPIVKNDTPTAATRDFKSLSTWRERVDYGLSSIGNFVKQHVVRIHDLEDKQPLRLSSDQRRNIIQSISLLIDQAKTASLRGDQQRFTSALTSAADALKTYLPNETDPLNHERLLRSLSQITLNPELPRLTATYTALSTPITNSAEITTPPTP